MLQFDQLKNVFQNVSNFKQNPKEKHPALNICVPSKEVILWSALKSLCG